MGYFTQLYQRHTPALIEQPSALLHSSAPHQLNGSFDPNMTSSSDTGGLLHANETYKEGGWMRVTQGKGTPLVRAIMDPKDVAGQV